MSNQQQDTRRSRPRSAVVRVVTVGEAARQPHGQANGQGSERHHDAPGRSHKRVDHVDGVSEGAGPGGGRGKRRRGRGNRSAKEGNAAPGSEAPPQVSEDVIMAGQEEPDKRDGPKRGRSGRKGAGADAKGPALAAAAESRGPVQPGSRIKKGISRFTAIQSQTIVPAVRGVLQRFASASAFLSRSVPVRGVPHRNPRTSNFMAPKCEAKDKLSTRIAAQRQRRPRQGQDGLRQDAGLPHSHSGAVRHPERYGRPLLGQLRDGIDPVPRPHADPRAGHPGEEMGSPRPWNALSLPIPSLFYPSTLYPSLIGRVPSLPTMLSHSRRLMPAVLFSPLSSPSHPFVTPLCRSPGMRPSWRSSTGVSQCRRLSEEPTWRRIGATWRRGGDAISWSGRRAGSTT